MHPGLDNQVWLFNSTLTSTHSSRVPTATASCLATSTAIPSTLPPQNHLSDGAITEITVTIIAVVILLVCLSFRAGIARGRHKISIIPHVDTTQGPVNPPRPLPDIPNNQGAGVAPPTSRPHPLRDDRFVEGPPTGFSLHVLDSSRGKRRVIFPGFEAQLIISCVTVRSSHRILDMYSATLL